MSRAIKFRAWHKQNRKMYEVAMLCDSGSRYLREEGQSDDVLLSVSPEDIDLLQYIGISDKTGKDIYEGDIIRTTLGKSLLEVRWSTFGFRFFDLMQQEWYLMWAADIKRLEIIGNIYEHPHLLPQPEKEQEKASA